MTKAAISSGFYVSSVWCDEILQGWLISGILSVFFQLFLQGLCRETVLINFKDMHSLALVARSSLFSAYMDSGFAFSWLLCVCSVWQNAFLWCVIETNNWKLKSMNVVLLPRVSSNQNYLFYLYMFNLASMGYCWKLIHIFGLNGFIECVC